MERKNTMKQKTNRIKGQWKKWTAVLCTGLCIGVIPNTVLASELPISEKEILLSSELPIVEEEPILSSEMATENQKTYKPSEDVFYELIYEIDTTGVVITGVVATANSDGKISGQLIIPEKIENTTVYKIGEGAFQDCRELYGDLNIPKGVVLIENNAFSGCSGFYGKLNLPEGLVTIGNRAFYSCINLSDGEIPESVVTIGDEAFNGVTSICNKTQYFSKNLKTIGQYAFYSRSVGTSKNYYVTDKTTKIGTWAFDSNVTVYAPNLSYAQLYAKNNGYKYIEYDWKGQLSVEEIKFNQYSISMSPWEQQTLKVEVLPNTARDKTLVWTSSNEEVAAVKDGVITAKAYGTATITAISSNGITASCTVKVEDPTIPVEEIKLNKDVVSLYLWQEETFEAAIYPNDATDKTLVWTSNDEKVATVKEGKVTAVGYGACVITATAVNGVKATCIINVEREFPFEDVNANGWEYKGINYVYQRGLMTGISTKEFRPNDKLSRSQFVVVLHSYAKKPAITFTNTFLDVSNGQWYSNAVIWAVNQKITSGYPNGNFGVADDITREQFVTMLYQYAKSIGKVTGTQTGNLSGYTDYRQVSSYALQPMLWAVNNGLVSGKPEGNGQVRIDPQGNTTRAECAAIMMQFDSKF